MTAIVFANANTNEDYEYDFLRLLLVWLSIYFISYQLISYYIKV